MLSCWVSYSKKMIIQKLFKLTENNEDLKEGLISGLIVGLIFGFISGLISGLIVCLISGLIFGLINGLTFGLIFGLGFGLGYFINFFAFLGLASLISHYPSFIPIWLLIILGIFILELFYWFDIQKKPKKFNKFWFTALKKGEALLETIAVFGYLNLFRLGIKKIINFTSYDILIKWIGYIGIGIISLGIIVLVLYVYIKLNSLKFKEKRK